jgi:cardiolipin synthase
VLRYAGGMTAAGDPRDGATTGSEVASGGPRAAELLDGGPQAYPRMLAAIAAARRTVRLEVYAFADDEIGQRFIAALTSAAARGVQVTVVLDGWGSSADGAEIVRRLGEAGCTAVVYNPLASLLLGHFGRNHRKILLVDDEVAYLGGINISDEYGRTGEPNVPHWLDLAIELRGESVAWLSARLAGRRLPVRRGPVRIHLSGIGGGRRLRRRYLKAIGAARRSIVVAHAYFLPDRRLVRSITAASRRGVLVTLILPGLSDVPLARAASRSLYAALLRAGVHIHEWTETVLHAKAAVMDGRRLLIGSFNLDPFSLANLESLVEVADPTVAREGRAWMERLLSGATPITAERLASRPLLVRWFLDRLGLAVLRVANRIARLLALR